MTQERRKCSICLVECFINSIELPCGHQYHHDCLHTLLDSHQKAKCCECRVEYQFSADATAIILPEEPLTEEDKECIRKCNARVELFGMNLVYAFALIMFWYLIVSPIVTISFLCIHGRLPNTHLHKEIIETLFMIGFFVDVGFLGLFLYIHLVKCSEKVCHQIKRWIDQKIFKREILVIQLPDYNPIVLESVELNVV